MTATEDVKKWVDEMAHDHPDSGIAVGDGGLEIVCLDNTMTVVSYYEIGGIPEDPDFEMVED